MLAHWFTPAHCSAFKNTHFSSKSQASVSCCRDWGAVPSVGVHPCFSIRHAHRLLSNQSGVLFVFTLQQPYVMHVFVEHDPGDPSVLLLCICPSTYWWEVAASKPPRHKHFLNRALPNKPVINKSSASTIPAGESKTRCWGCRNISQMFVTKFRRLAVWYDYSAAHAEHSDHEFLNVCNTHWLNLHWIYEAKNIHVLTMASILANVKRL